MVQFRGNRTSFLWRATSHDLINVNLFFLLCWPLRKKQKWTWRDWDWIWDPQGGGSHVAKTAAIGIGIGSWSWETCLSLPITPHVCLCVCFTQPGTPPCSVLFFLLPLLCRGFEVWTFKIRQLPPPPSFPSSSSF